MGKPLQALHELHSARIAIVVNDLATICFINFKTILLLRNASSLCDARNALLGLLNTHLTALVATVVR